MLNNRDLDKEDAIYNAIIPGASKANPFGSLSNDEYGGEYPTVVYTMNGEPRAFSATLFTIALNYAIRISKYADFGVSLIFTERYWNI